MSNNFDFDFNLPDPSHAAAGQSLPPDETEEGARLGYPYAKFLQGNSTLEGYPKGTGAGFIAVGENKQQETGAIKWEGYLFERLYFLPIDKLTNDQTGSARKGARGLWPFSMTDGKSDYVEGGEKKKMLCKSGDGLAPFHTFLGTKVKLPLNHDKYPGGTAVIGFGSVIPAGATGEIEMRIPAPSDVCNSCPLGAWYKDKTTGKSKQLCSPRFLFAVYAPKQASLRLTGNAKSPFMEAEWPGGVILLQGASRSSQMSLTSGDGRRSSAKTMEGRDLQSFFSLIARHQTGVYIRRPKTELTAELVPMVRGFATDLDADPRLGTGAELNDLAKLPEMQFVVLEYPSYKYAQAGLPQQVGVDAALPGMRLLVANVAKIDVLNSPNGPDLAVSAEMVNEEDALNWMQALDDYAAANARAILLGTENNLPEVQDKLLLATGQGWRMLTEGGAAPSSVPAQEVIDADQLDDMP